MVGTGSYLNGSLPPLRTSRGSIGPGRPLNPQISRVQMSLVYPRVMDSQLRELPMRANSELHCRAAGGRPVPGGCDTVSEPDQRAAGSSHGERCTISQQAATIEALEAAGTAETVKARSPRPLIRKEWKAMADILTMAKDELRAKGKADAAALAARRYPARRMTRSCWTTSP